MSSCLFCFFSPFQSTQTHYSRHRSTTKLSQAPQRVFLRLPWKILQTLLWISVLPRALFMGTLGTVALVYRVVVVSCLAETIQQEKITNEGRLPSTTPPPPPPPPSTGGSTSIVGYHREASQSRKILYLYYPGNSKDHKLG